MAYSGDVEVDAEKDDSTPAPLSPAKSCQNDYRKFIQFMAPNLREENIDILLLYNEEDRQEAERFKDSVERDCIICVNGKTRYPKVELENRYVYDGNPFYLDLAFNKALYIFLFCTSNFCNEDTGLLKAYACLTTALEERVKERRWCVIPVYTEKDSKRGLPMMFKALQPIRYYDRYYYQSAVTKLLEAKVSVRLTMDIELDKKRQRHFEQNKDKLIQLAQEFDKKYRAPQLEDQRPKEFQRSQPSKSQNIRYGVEEQGHVLSKDVACQNKEKILSTSSFESLPIGEKSPFSDNLSGSSPIHIESKSEGTISDSCVRQSTCGSVSPKSGHKQIDNISKIRELVLGGSEEVPDAKEPVCKDTGGTSSSQQNMNVMSQLSEEVIEVDSGNSLPVGDSNAGANNSDVSQQIEMSSLQVFNSHLSESSSVCDQPYTSTSRMLNFQDDHFSIDSNTSMQVHPPSSPSPPQNSEETFIESMSVEAADAYTIQKPVLQVQNSRVPNSDSGRGTSVASPDIRGFSNHLPTVDSQGQSVSNNEESFQYTQTPSPPNGDPLHRCGTGSVDDGTGEGTNITQVHHHHHHHHHHLHKTYIDHAQYVAVGASPAIKVGHEEPYDPDVSDQANLVRDPSQSDTTASGLDQHSVSDPDETCLKRYESQVPPEHVRQTQMPPADVQMAMPELGSYLYEGYSSNADY